MERQRREEELKTRSSKKGQEAEQGILNRVGDPFSLMLFGYELYLPKKIGYIEWILLLFLSLTI